MTAAHNLLLALTGLIAVVFAAAMVLQRSLYASAICLLVALIQVGAAFYLLGLELLAFLQVMIYAGAVMVMLVEAVMAAPPSLRERFAPLAVPRWLVPLAGAALLAETLGFGALSAAAPVAGGASPAEFAALLFGAYAPLTEAVGLMLMMAALAVIVSVRGLHPGAPSVERERPRAEVRP